MNQKLLIVEDQFAEANSLRLMLLKAGYQVTGIARTVEKAREMIKREMPDLVLLDIFLKGRLTGIDLGAELKAANIPFIYISANSNDEILNAAKITQPDGFIVKPFREKDVLITMEIAHYRHRHNLESGFQQQVRLKNQLRDIMKDQAAPARMLLQVARALQTSIPFEYLGISVQKNGETAYSYPGFRRIGFDEYQLIGNKELTTIANLKGNEISAIQARTKIDATAKWYHENEFSQLCKHSPLSRLIGGTFGIRSHLVYPLLLASGEIAYFSFYSRRPDAYTDEHLFTFNQLQFSLAEAFGQILALDRSVAGSVSGAGNSPSRQGTGAPGAFDGIIGNSHLLLNVFDHITRVSPTDTSVLILGESGTGKERIADAIHRLSPRAGKPLVKVNCAALPATLIESELFGHEKGSFTGALDKRIGKFEQAHTGTVFLDEIGEMPVELQIRFLRVLQEKEIERIGSKSPIRVDVRIIAATNRNLEREVSEGRFRLDLYYRLNVFPIALPPLRDRKEDLPALVSHFIHYYNRKAGKQVSGFSNKAFDKLLAYHWPGNIRELEHLIERSILLAKGSVIEDISLSVLQRREPAPTMEELKMKTMHENERDYILTVLRRCKGKVWGPGAAAEILNIPPSTLKSRMKKLGIKKEFME